jgi:hypothetical protein
VKFQSIETWYLRSRDLTGFVVRCPLFGRRDEVTALLTGDHEIDGVMRTVVAVGGVPPPGWWPPPRDGVLVSLMIRGKL